MANRRRGPDGAWRFRTVLTLADILADLVQRAAAADGAVVMHCLPRGLWIRIRRLPHDGGYELNISRPDVVPSLLEWVTVCRAWPWKVPISYEPVKSLAGSPSLSAVLPLAAANPEVK